MTVGQTGIPVGLSTKTGEQRKGQLGGESASMLAGRIGPVPAAWCGAVFERGRPVVPKEPPLGSPLFRGRPGGQAAWFHFLRWPLGKESMTGAVSAGRGSWGE